MKLPFEWELIYNVSFGWTHRAKVIGGWLIRVFAVGDNSPESNCNDPCISMIFIPDPMHEWVIEKENEGSNFIHDASAQNKNH